MTTAMRTRTGLVRVDLVYTASDGGLWAKAGAMHFPLHEGPTFPVPAPTGYRIVLVGGGRHITIPLEVYP